MGQNIDLCYLIFILTEIKHHCCMSSVITIFTFIILLISLLPFCRNQHWIFRVPDFIRPQLLVLQLTILGFDIYYFDDLAFGKWGMVGIIICILYNFYVFARFTKFWRSNKLTPSQEYSRDIKVISVNVYQYNKAFHRFIAMIRTEQPDIFLTMESNMDWENAIASLADEYPYSENIALENTYGMHFYTKFKIKNLKVHYFVSDDLPSIEAELETADGYKFVFFGVHPPPPSPTEEETSKERDGDLLSVAKQAKKKNLPILITGDFNTVAWSRESILFKKSSGLIDARYGRGYLATFHTKYWFFRIPLDLLYHSTSIFIKDLKILPSIGSDHFPISCVFYIDKYNDDQEDEVKTLDSDEKQEVDELIEEGQDEESENRDKEGE